MFTVNIKGEKTPKNEHLVKLELVFYKKGYSRVTKALNITGPYKEWDATTQSFKGRLGDCVVKNKNLLDLRLKYQQVGENWEAEERIWSPVELSHAFDKEVEKRESIKVLTVSQMIDSLIDKYNKKERIKNGQIIQSYNNEKQYEYLKNSLAEFCNEYYKRSFATYFFQDITETFLLDFTLYTKKKGLRNGNNGGLKNKLRRLRAVCNYAQRQGIPHASYELFECLGETIKWDKTTSKAVSTATMYKIEYIDRSLFSVSEELYLDLFLFSYYAGGMANVDVCNLTWDSIQDGHIIYERIKCPRVAKMVLNEKTEKLMTKYKGHCYQDYIFPVFTHKHTTSAKKTVRVKHIGTLVTNVLNKACQILGIDEKMTWYSARGSFISRMVDEGYSAHTVAGMAGNSPMVIDKHYYKNTNSDDIKATMNGW